MAVLCHGLMSRNVSCSEVTHSGTGLCGNMNVWLGARPVLLLNGLLLWLRLLFSLFSREKLGTGGRWGVSKHLSADWARWIHAGVNGSVHSGASVCWSCRARG